MKTKHTKGKWNQCCAETAPHFVFADEDKAVCSLRCNDPANLDYNSMEGVVTNEERIANAKLIAAAPEMLEALIRVEAYLVANEDVLAPFPTRSELDNIRWAIRKATE